MCHSSFERNQRADSGESTGSKLFVILNVGGKLFAEETSGCDRMVCLSQSLDE
jgi:hypothetical protein